MNNVTDIYRAIIHVCKLTPHGQWAFDSDEGRGYQCQHEDCPGRFVMIIPSGSHIVRLDQIIPCDKKYYQLTSKVTFESLTFQKLIKSKTTHVFVDKDLSNRSQFEIYFAT